MLGCRQAMIDEFDLDMDHEISEQEFIKCVDFSCELLWKVGADEVGAASWRMMCEGSTCGRFTRVYGGVVGGDCKHFSN
mgnify:FL=1